MFHVQNPRMFSVRMSAILKSIHRNTLCEQIKKTDRKQRTGIQTENRKQTGKILLQKTAASEKWDNL